MNCNRAYELKNSALRTLMKRKRVPMWRLADEVGVCLDTLRNRFRREMDADSAEKMRIIIERLAAEQEAE